MVGENVFAGHASLETVELGAGAQLGRMAFYNCSSLHTIDLSKATKIGDYAFSGDVYYICLDDAMAYAAVSPEGEYMYTHHAPAIITADISSAESVGEYAFAYCRAMTDMKLNPAITEIPQYAFAGCISLQNINLSKVVTLGDYAFMESELLASVDLSAAETIGKYAFVNGKAVADVKLNPNGATIDEGAFAYCELLSTVKNLNKATSIGDYAFAYAGMVEANLSGAEHIGTHAFLKEELTDFTVTLGENLKTLGDNPFAMCKLQPFSISQDNTFNGKKYPENVYTYDLSDTVHIIDGSLYGETENGGYVLIAYAGPETRDIKVAEGTARIGSFAFAGSAAERVTLPHTATSIGHKAFYLCDALEYVVFQSYYAPILEEEFDSTYYETYDHIPGTGNFGTYNDYDGTEVSIDGFGLIPYYMWNATGGMYSNVFYGANFVDYVGFVEQKLTMVRPANGKNYDSFIMNQYFDLVIDGANAADDVTLAAIKAIDSIPERVAFEDKAIVDAAREAYSKIATTEQQALVTNYGILVSAEQRVIALDPANQVQTEEEVVEEKTSNAGSIWFLIAVVVLTVVCIVLSKVDFKKAIAAIKNVNWKELPKNFWNALKAVPGKILSWMKTVPGKCKLLWAAAKALFAKIKALLPKKKVAPVEETSAVEETPAEEVVTEE